MTHELHILNRDGDKTLTWGEAAEDEVRNEFDILIARGYLAYRLDGPTSGEVIREFDPSAATIIVHAPLVGG